MRRGRGGVDPNFRGSASGWDFEEVARAPRPPWQIYRAWVHADLKKTDMWECQRLAAERWNCLLSYRKERQRGPPPIFHPYFNKVIVQTIAPGEIFEIAAGRPGLGRARLKWK